MVLDTGFMESVPLRLSPKLLLTTTFSMDVDMDMLDTTDTHMVDTGFMESVPLKLSLRLLPTPIFSMDVDMDMVDMDTLDMLDTTDTHMVDMPTTDKPALP